MVYRVGTGGAHLKFGCDISTLKIWIKVVVIGLRNALCSCILLYESVRRNTCEIMNGIFDKNFVFVLNL